MGWLREIFGGGEQDEAFGYVKDKPISAGRLDKPAMVIDELNRPVKQTVTGQTYTVGYDPDQRTTKTKIEEDVLPVVEDWINDPSLPEVPEWETVKSVGKSMVKDAYSPFYNLAHGKGTYGDLWESVGAISGVGAMAKAPAGSVRMMAGRSAIPDEDINTYDNMIKGGVSPSSAWRQTNVWYDDYNKEYRTIVPTEHAKFKDFDFEKHRKKLETIDLGDAPDGKMGDLFEFNEFYAKYPEAADINLLVRKLPEGYNGWFDKENNALIINAYAEPESARSTLIHELQHWLQEKDALKNGTSPDMVEEKYALAKPEEYRKVQKLVLEANVLKSRYKITGDAQIKKRIIGKQIQLHNFKKKMFSYYSNNRGELEARATQAMDNEVRGLQVPEMSVAASSEAPQVTNFIERIKRKAEKRHPVTEKYSMSPEEYINTEVHPDTPKYGEDALKPSDNLYGHMLDKDPDGIITKMLNMRK